jgi:membrane-bound lytic murein transglycosylase A
MLKFLILLVLSNLAFAKNPIIPAKPAAILPSFTDDLDFKEMRTAIARQLKSFGSSPLTGSIVFGTQTYPKKVLQDTLTHFLTLVDAFELCVKHSKRSSCYQDLSQKVSSDFDIYAANPLANEPGYKQNAETLFTGYYSPDFEGSKTQTERFKYPIYGLPTKKELLNLTRVEIDFENKLANKNLELFYVDSSFFDLYLLHVEGGGRVKVKKADGSYDYFYLSYAGHNGKSFQMIYKYMLEKGYLESGSASIDHQRQFLANNPDKQKEIFATCPSYIFFKITKTEPLGIRNIPLTQNRSIAIDHRTFKQMGMLHFIQAKKGMRTPEGVELKNMDRFMISQDTGGAIRGNARVDLYFGYGDDAEASANNVKVMGKQFFLVKKVN